MLGRVGRVCVQSSKTKQTKPKGQLSVNTVNVKTNEQEKEKKKKKKEKKEEEGKSCITELFNQRAEQSTQ